MVENRQTWLGDISYYDLADDEKFGLNLLATRVVEREVDVEDLGNWTGLFNAKGQPLFKEKQRIGFKIGRS